MAASRFDYLKDENENFEELDCVKLNMRVYDDHLSMKLFRSSSQPLKLFGERERERAHVWCLVEQD